MRKIICLLLAAAAMVSLAACGGAGTQSTAPASDPAPAATSAPTATPGPTPTPEPTPTPAPTQEPLLGKVLYEADGVSVTLANYTLEEGSHPDFVTLDLEMRNDTDASADIAIVDAAMGGYMISCYDSGVENIAGTVFLGDDYTGEPRVTVPAGESVTVQLNLQGDACASTVQFALAVTGAAGTVRSEPVTLTFAEVKAAAMDRAKAPFFSAPAFTAAYSYATLMKGYSVQFSFSDLSDRTLRVTLDRMTANGLTVPAETLQHYHWRITPGNRFLAEIYIGDVEELGLNQGDDVSYEVCLTVTDDETGEVVAESGPIAFTGTLD